MKVKMFSSLVSPKISFFAGRLKEPICGDLEDAINAWLAERPGVTIHQVKQSVHGGGFGSSADKIIITIFYED